MQVFVINNVDSAVKAKKKYYPQKALVLEEAKKINVENH